MYKFFIERMESISERILCIICDTSYASKNIYRSHLNSNSHKLKDPNNTEIIIEFLCEKCSITCNSLKSYNQHLKSKQHNMSAEEYKEMLSQMGKDAIIHGEENELFTVDLLKTLDFENVVHRKYSKYV